MMSRRFVPEHMASTMRDSISKMGSGSGIFVELAGEARIAAMQDHPGLGIDRQFVAGIDNRPGTILFIKTEPGAIFP